ncbi:10873_t:CDS:2 [Dentiscutata erythropus]|uniref:10873_t:CDS:1 n=1 Tax=Dentiscutata erythropus TaxID=1348616 RepID=A0A9N9D469_9GLOM|nr:10873_t:CDS:2 [Dentiscutata erythropus]
MGELNNSKKNGKSTHISEDEVTEQIKSTKRTLSQSDTDPSTEKKKKTKEKKKKIKPVGRNKGPIDLDKQCGVIQYPKTTPCTRSLTCKTHSVGSKRAVQGRSKRYDELLAEHQKKKAAERPPKEIAVSNNKQDNKIDDSERDVAVIDSDAEVDAVMEATMCYKPRPLVTRPNYYLHTPRTSDYFKYDELLHSDITTPDTC